MKHRRTDPDTSTLFDDLREVVTAPDPSGGAHLPQCSTGLLLRGLLGVQGVLAVGLLFGARNFNGWLHLLATVATLTVPLTLAWLLLICWLRPLLLRCSPALQTPLASALGGVLTALSWLPLSALGMTPDNPLSGVAPVVAGAVLAGMAYQSERWRLRARLPAVAAARLADLQTRIRPHFLFNTLNTAIALVQHNPQQAEQVLEDLSDLFRAALGALDESTTLHDEIELSQRYLAIEQLRFGSRLRVRWELDPLAAGARLPPLALQPLIENAVRHGVEPSDDGGDIEIRTLRRRDRVLVSVTNSLPAHSRPRPGHGIGMASVRERLRLLHDLEADFRGGIIEDGRWRTSLSVPAG